MNKLQVFLMLCIPPSALFSLVVIFVTYLVFVYALTQLTVHDMELKKVTLYDIYQSPIQMALVLELQGKSDVDVARLVPPVLFLKVNPIEKLMGQCSSVHEAEICKSCSHVWEKQYDKLHSPKPSTTVWQELEDMRI